MTRSSEGNAATIPPRWAGLVVVLGLLPSPAAGQLLFDWPLRADPEPEALLTGAAAVLWNPAGMAVAPSQLWILSAEGPTESDLGGIGVAVTGRLPFVGTVGLSYRHLGIEDIPRTTDSPEPALGDVDVSEDAVGAGLARTVGPWLALGGSVRHLRASVEGRHRDRTEGQVGASLRPPLPVEACLAVAILGMGGDERVLTGVRVVVPRRWTRPFRMAGAWGADLSTRRDVLDQRLSVRISWHGVFHGGAGVTFPGSEADDPTHLWTVGAEVGRYSVAFLREEVAGGFGAANFYRIRIALP